MNCGVVALSIVTGAPYPQVWDWFEARRRRAAPWLGETDQADYAACARALGTQLRSLRRGRGATIAKWAAQYAEAGATYLIASIDHVGVLCDGVYADNSKMGPLRYRPGVRRCLVTQVWAVHK